ncbi:MAG TPA: PAS domain S-box protein [Candidatus Acidoferrum sp.]|jgi:PAS domain S-box-containing protein|nr:PAS domain S-box protein [Candidatus Acidoferrum sp.]
MKKEIRILILEDVAADAVRINHELRREGLSFHCKRVETRVDFLHELQRHPPDLILSDHGLPSFDGFTALAIARNQYPDVPFIFVTGSLGEQMAIEALKSGATDYILKKDLSKLGPAVQRALRETEERLALKQKEQQLRESEERYRRLIEFCPDAFFVECEGRIVFANMTAARLLGVENAEKLVDCPISQIIHPDSWAALEKRFAALSENGTTFFWRKIQKGSVQRIKESGPVFPFIEERFVRADGSTVAVEVAATPLTLQNRQAIQFMARDITSRQKGEESLRKSEALKSAILDTALDAIISIDHEGLIQEWNAAAQKIFGYSRAETVGKPVDELIIPAALLEIYHDGLANYLMTGAGSLVGKPIELTLRRADGREFRAEMAISRALTERPPRCTALIRDISERKHAELLLRQSEERLRLLIESAKDYAIYMLDSEGNVATWNTGAQHLEGYRAEEIIGKHFSIFFVPEDVARGAPKEFLQQAEREGKVLNEGWRLREDGSRFWSEGIITALRDEKGKLIGFSKIAHDITTQKETEERIHQLNEQLEQRVRERTAELEAANTELEAFSYSVSHDLRAPLLHISGFVDMLQNEAASLLDDKSKEHLQTIADSAKQMGSLIDALLDFCRMGRSEMGRHPVNVVSLVEEARRTFRRETKDRNIEWKIGELPEVQGDPVMLRQVIVNLLSNALKYTRARSPTIIEIGATHGEQEDVFSVHDNGVGFDMQYAGKLFGVFQRLHPVHQFEGTGIGLANVRRIIHRHGGRVWAESAPDNGATFYFSIPRLISPTQKGGPYEKQ